MDKDELGFTIDPPGGVRVMHWPNGSCRPATDEEIVLWDALLAAKQQEPATCGCCHGTGWMVRDPDIGTDQECFACDGTGKLEDAAPVQAQPVSERENELLEHLLTAMDKLAMPFAHMAAIDKAGKAFIAARPQDKPVSTADKEK